MCRDCRKIKSKLDFSKQTQEYKIFHRAKTRANKEGLPFDIEISDIVIPLFCPVLNHAFVLGDTHWTPSIDRVIPELGYIKGNIRIISNRANRLKNDATLEELEMIIAYIQKHIWPDLKIPPINLWSLPR